jgi:hypothetical protein
MSTNQPALPLTGGCSCGAIRYEITAFPFLLYTCNCTNCQRASGSAFVLNMPVATAALRFVKGTPKGWPHLSPTGVPVTSWFCGDCGGRLYGERSARPEVMMLRAGTLDDTSWLVPVAHFFMKSAQRWVDRPPGVECYETAPEDYMPLVAQWRAMWPQFFPAQG